jgi:adenylate cyclase
MAKKILKFIGLGVGLLLLMWLFISQGFFMGIQKSLQNKFYDYQSASSQIVVVAMDEKTMRQLGGAPPLWPRATYAKALQMLNDKGAAVVGIDVTFPDLSGKGPADDEAFRDALQKYPNTVLAGRILFSETGEAIAETPNATLLEAKPAIGWINVNLDEDNFVRRIPIYNAVKDQSAEAFSLEVARKFLKAEPQGTQVRKGLYPFSDTLSIPALTLRDSATQKDSYLMYVNYFSAPGGYSRISLSDVLAGTFTDSTGKTVDLKGKIVLIGPTAIDLQDQYLSPVSQGVKMPGVEIHANNIQTIIEGQFLRDQSTTSLWITLLAILLVNLFLFSRLRVRFAIPVLALELFGSAVAGIVGYEYRIFLNVVYPMLLAILSFTSAYLLRFILEQSERQFAEKAFGQYVSKELVEEILKNPTMLKLGGAKREVTVFFSDIEGFTSLSEKMQPEPLVKFLNEYLGAMTGIILGHLGTLDKYEGDAIMAFWGAPLPQPDHAKNACLAALENQKKLAELREKWIQQGLPPLRVRIGIHTGEVVAGNMGSESRFDYTVMGDNVNLASRLEGINKQYETYLLISESTRNALGDDFVCRELDLIRVKGKEKPVKIFELVGKKGDVPAETVAKIEAFEKALLAYRAKNFSAAAEQFKGISDDKASRIFQTRCENFLNLPPAEKWDGVYTFTEK